MKKDKKQKDIVQLKNPKTGRYVKIDRIIGKIFTSKRTFGSYKNIPIVTKRKTTH